MEKQMHVLSFDEASRAARSHGSQRARNTRSSQRSSMTSRQTRSRGSNATGRSTRSYEPALSLESMSRNRSYASSAMSAPSVSLRRSAPTPSSASSSRKRNQRTSSAFSSPAPAKNKSANSKQYSSRSARRDAFRNNPKGDAYARTQLDEACAASEEERCAKKESFIARIQKKQRARRKEKAGKQFSRQFESAPSDASASGPRAALYTGSIGNKQRQAMDMQQSSVSGNANKRGMRRAQRRDFLHSPKALILGIVAACLIGACVVMYPTARGYYQAIRYNDQLEAEYAAIQERNAALQQEVDSLQTDEGVEQRVHELYGWVGEGENSVLVQGLQNKNTSTSTGYQTVILPNSVPAPETWYSPVLDFVFGFENVTSTSDGANA